MERVLTPRPLFCGLPNLEAMSGRELSEMLAEAGFRQIETKPTFGYNSIVTGIKPAAADG